MLPQSKVLSPDWVGEKPKWGLWQNTGRDDRDIGGSWWGRRVGGGGGEEELNISPAEWEDWEENSKRKGTVLRYYLPPIGLFGVRWEGGRLPVSTRGSPLTSPGINPYNIFSFWGSQTFLERKLKALPAPPLLSSPLRGVLAPWGHSNLSTLKMSRVNCMSKIYNLQVDKLLPDNHIGLKQKSFTNIRGFVAFFKRGILLLMRRQTTLTLKKSQIRITTKSVSCTFFPMRDLCMWGMTPPPAMVALISVSSSSSPLKTIS